MGLSYTNIKRKRKHSRPTKRQRLTKLLVGLIATAISLAAVYTIVKSSWTSDSDPSKTQTPDVTISGLTDPDNFIAAYVLANCGDNQLEEIQSIRISGRLAVDDASNSFTMFKKRPDLMRLNFKQGVLEITITANGDTVWSGVQAPQQVEQFALIEGDKAKQWLHMGHFLNQIVEHYINNKDLPAIQIADRQGKEYLQVSFQNNDGSSESLLVDPLTMHVDAGIRIAADGIVSETTFSDYRNVQGMMIPFQMVTSINDEIVSRTQIKQASINTGVPSWLFKLPESLNQATMN